MTILRKTMVMSFLIAASLAVTGENFKMDSADGYGKSSFNQVGRWSYPGGGQPTTGPCAGNTYETQYLMRTPTEPGDYVFGGDSLTLKGGQVQFKGGDGDTITIGRLIVDGSGIIGNSQGGTFVLDGNLALVNGATVKFQCGENDVRNMRVGSSVSGEGTIWCQTVKTDNNKRWNKFIALEGDNSGFFGKVLVTGASSFYVADDQCLGAVPDGVIPDAITFSGPRWIITNNLVVAATRGLVVSNESNVVSDCDQCRYPGMQIQVQGGMEARILGPVSGPGPIEKAGDWGVLHFSGSFADYTGAITLGRGTTYFDGPESVSLASVTLSSALAFTSTDLTVARFVLGNAEFRPYFANVARDVPRLTITESLTFTADVQSIKIYPESPFNGEVGVPYALIRAPGTMLSEAMANGMLSSTEPILDAIDVVDNGDGTETLYMTHRDDSKVYYHVGSDGYNQSSFRNANWSLKGSDVRTTIAPGNVYVIKDKNVRTPVDGDYTFNGDLLMFVAGGMMLKGPCLTSLPNTVCYGATEWAQNDELYTVRVGGQVKLLPLGSPSLVLSSVSQLRKADILCDLSGAGDLQMYGHGNPAYGARDYAFSLLGDNRAFSGSTYVSGQTNFYCRITSEESLGRNPGAFKERQLRFNGGGLLVTSSVVLDDANRGIYLEAVGGVCTASDADAKTGASYATTVPEADRRFPGGAWFNADGRETVLTVNCPIAGDGDLGVYAGGKVELGGRNTYSGQTVVHRGTLAVNGPDALGTGSVVVKSGGVLCAPFNNPNMPNGIVLKSQISFEKGGAVSVALSAESFGTDEFTVPVMLLAEGQAMPSDIKFAGKLKGWRARLDGHTVNVGGVDRTRIDATLYPSGLIFFVK